MAVEECLLRRHIARLGGCLVLLLMLLPVSVTGAERGFVPVRRTEGGFVALVIGNGGYPDQPLTNPVNDATDVAAALASIGFRVLPLLDADREVMAQGIAQFREALPRAQAAVFYYAGHGAQVLGENWLLPIGRTSSTQITDESQVPNRAISANEILMAMEQAKVPMNVVVLDACRNNPFRGSGRGRIQGLAELRAPVGSLILYATSPGKTAADGQGGRNSPFTSAFLKHVLTPGLDIRLLPSEITNTVGELTGGAQVPWQSASLKAGFFFVPPLSEDEKFAAEKARKTEELRQAELQVRLSKLAAQVRESDAAKQRELEVERERVETALAASRKESAEITKQLTADLAAARDREQADLNAAKMRENAALAAKQQEIAALDAKIAALKSANTPAGSDSDLDGMVAVMELRKARRAELQRMEQEAKEKQAKAAADAAHQRRQEVADAAERRKRAEVEVKSQQKAAIQAVQAKEEELVRLEAAGRAALAKRFDGDVAKYQNLAASVEGRDMAPAAWGKICALYDVGDVKQGDYTELTFRVLPERKIAARAKQKLLQRMQQEFAAFEFQRKYHSSRAALAAWDKLCSNLGIDATSVKMGEDSGVYRALRIGDPNSVFGECDDLIGIIRYNEDFETRTISEQPWVARWVYLLAGNTPDVSGDLLKRAISSGSAAFFGFAAGAWIILTFLAMVLFVPIALIRKDARNVPLIECLLVPMLSGCIGWILSYFSFGRFTVTWVSLGILFIGTIWVIIRLFRREVVVVPNPAPQEPPPASG